MNLVRNTLSLLLLILNILVGIGYLLCAYSPYISPTEHPILALAGLCMPIFIISNFVFLIFWLIVEWKYAFISVLFLLLGWDALCIYMPINMGSPESKGKTLKVLTYNVLGMHETTDTSGKSVNSILNYINESDADIVCLQEYPTWNSSIEKSLKKKYPYIRIHEKGIACLSKKPIVSMKAIALKSETNGSIIFRIKDGKKTIPVIANHLESNKLDDHDKDIYKGMIKNPGKEKVKSGSRHLIHKLADAVAIRAPQADLVAKAIKEIDNERIIVCGDFNDTPISYTRRVIAEGLQDTFAEAGNGPGISYNRNFLFFRIDHLLVGKAYRVIHCEVDRSIDTSDHYPLWCILEK